MNFLAEQKNSGHFVNDWTQIEEFYIKKLWHQLTLKCLEFVAKPEFASGSGGTLLIEMYEKFIKDFEHRINQLSLVEICLHVVRQYKEPEAAVKFLSDLKEKVKHEQEPNILCNTMIGAIYLEQKNFDLTKKYVEETETLLNELDGVTSVHARYYELSSSFYRTIGNHHEYYKNALRYLGCIKHQDIPIAGQQELAFYVSLAALLGDGIYNFGELLMHPILQSLNGTSNQWLVDLLFAFNRGDLDRFDELKPTWSQQADLKAAEVKIRQKICLLCLMEMAFTRPANNKQLSFSDIATRTKLPENEIELLVMRALSLGLVKGSIDQIDKKVLISWVQPRVLDIGQIKLMRSKLDAWSSDVSKLIHQVNSNAREILT